MNGLPLGGGVDPHFHEHSIHVGLVMTENVDATERLNVQHRLKKVKQATFGYLKNILWDPKHIPSLETKMNLY